MSTLLAADMEARVCSSLVEQVRARNVITAHASPRVRIADGLIATFEAINFVHLPFINLPLYHLQWEFHLLSLESEILKKLQFSETCYCLNFFHFFSRMSLKLPKTEKLTKAILLGNSLFLIIC